jgi:Domain of unknown function (DUF4388)
VTSPLRAEHPRIRELLQRDVEAVLWGELGSIHATEVFDILAQGRKTGLLLVSRDGIERIFAFHEGDLVFGFSSALDEGDDAREAVLGVVRVAGAGSFTFLSAAATEIPQSVRRQNVQEVVLDALRRLDEGEVLTATANS